MSVRNDVCYVCNEPVKGKKNICTFDCGHKNHLSCVLPRASVYDTKCPACSEVQNLNLKPNMGDDRTIAMNASMEARIKRRQMQPKPVINLFWRVVYAISPFRKPPSCMKDYVSANYDLSEILKLGYTSEDAVQERIPWQNINSRIDSNHILKFGFTWKDMVSMGIRPKDLKKFTWSQIKHTLCLDAKELLKLNMTLEELSDLSYSPHQLNDLGFTFVILHTMGANVKTFDMLNMTLEDIKTYFSPTAQQWASAGFYDKEKLKISGWELAKVSRILPPAVDHVSGRQLRLAF